MTGTSSVDPMEVYLGPNDGKPRILHVMIRVADFDASINFYVNLLGMKVLTERIESEASRVTAIFVGYDNPGPGGAVIELTQFWDEQGPYTQGTGYGHISIGTPDRPALLEKLKAAGIEPRRSGVAMFVKDPDGYEVELSPSVRP